MTKLISLPYESRTIIQLKVHLYKIVVREKIGNGNLISRSWWTTVRVNYSMRIKSYQGRAKVRAL